MKLHLWQQYSSNHCSSFTVIGEFPTRQDALHAARKVRAALKKIAKWHSQQDDSQNKPSKFGNPTPPEKELATQYQLEWENAIDWFNDAEVKVILECYVLLIPQHPSRNEVDGQPFEQLLERLGGKGYHQGHIFGESTGDVLLNLTCHAPNEAVVQAIYQKYVSSRQRIYRTGMTLHFDHWDLPDIQILPVLKADLVKRGCTDIQFSLSPINLLDDEFELYGSSYFDEVIDVLLDAQKKDDRIDAVYIFEEIGGSEPDLVEPLIKTLNDKDEWIRERVISIFDEIADARYAATYLERMFDTLPYIQHMTLRALSELQDTRAISPLRKLLANLESPILRKHIQQAIEKLEGKTASS